MKRFILVAVTVIELFLTSMSEAEVTHTISLDVKTNIDKLKLSISYENQSKSAFCVRYTDWDYYGLLSSLQLFDNKGNRIWSDIDKFTISLPARTDRYPAFFIVPPGETIRKDMDLNKVFGVSRKGIRMLNIRIAIPFVRCHVFERGYINIPRTSGLNEHVVFSETWAREEKEMAKDVFGEWYKNGYIAFGEVTWTARRE